jgi:hypothetical protein
MLAGSPNAAFFQNMPLPQVEGALAGWAAVNGISKTSVRSLDHRLSAVLQNTEERAGAAVTELEAHVTVARENYEAQAREVQLERQEFAKQHLAEVGRAGDAISEISKEWNDLRVSYIESLKLETPVALWEARAVIHDVGFKKLRGWAIGAGIVGAAIVAVLAAVLLYVIDDDGSGKALHKLIVAASLSLLAVTLFLWLMRLLVRALMSEQHLAIDARARSAMAHTYLALLKDDGNITEKDRAIVLASLFRPVTDGIVSDDALPLISPATLLSAKLAGGRD